MWKSLTLLVLITTGTILIWKSSQATWFAWDVHIVQVDGDLIASQVSVRQSLLKTGLANRWDDDYFTQYQIKILSNDVCNPGIKVSFERTQRDTFIEKASRVTVTVSVWLATLILGVTSISLLWRFYAFLKMRLDGIGLFVLLLSGCVGVAIVVIALLGPSVSSDPMCIFTFITTPHISPESFVTLRADLLGFTPEGITFLSFSLGFQLVALFLAIFWGRIARRLAPPSPDAIAD